MRRTLADIALLAWKDLRLEGRARAALPVMVVGGVVFLVVVAMGGGLADSGAGAATMLWAALLVSAVLGVERGMVIEREGGALAGVLATPVDRGVVFLAKLTANLVLLAATAILVSVVGMVLLGLEIGGRVTGFGAAIGLGLVGVAAVGTLFAAALGGGSGRRGLLVLLVLPVCVPVVVVSVRAAAAIASSAPGPGLGVLAAFDTVYVVAGWLAFEHVVDL